MERRADPYAALNINRFATSDEIQAAYRASARRFHPDANPHPAAADEFRLISQAYELLNDPQQRAQYDGGPQGTGQGPPLLRARLTGSRSGLPLLTEPQIVYGLLEITAEPAAAETVPAPPWNICLVIDRSTSMQGERLDQVKKATLPLIDQLREGDVFSIVTFSDRAEVVLPAQRNPDRGLAKAKVSTIYASGGTEILQGLVSGMAELNRYLNPLSVNHMILLTDGRTYGDEADSLSLASLAALDGINIHGLGIGNEWNDTFLDDLAGRTGGSTAYVNSPKALTHFFQDRLNGLSSTFAERVRLLVLPDPGVMVQSAFRSAPDPSPVSLAAQPMRLGSLRRGGQLEVLLQFIVPPSEAGRRWIARLIVQADVLGLQRMNERAASDLAVEVARGAPEETPPVAIVDALSKLTLYRLQEKAAAEAAAGQTQQATQRLERLASRLLASGEKGLAKTALVEARRLSNTNRISAEGQKTLKFGTRALFGPSQQDER
jgi:Ca-activated chloride channel family protein